MAKIISVPLSDPNSFLNVSVLTWHLSPLTWKIWISGHNRTPSSPTTTTKNTISISNLSYFIYILFHFFRRTASHKKTNMKPFSFFLFWIFVLKITQQKKEENNSTTTTSTTAIFTNCSWFSLSLVSPFFYLS